MQLLTGTNSSRIFLLSKQSSSAACRKGELLATEENAETKNCKGRQQLPVANARRWKASSTARHWSRCIPTTL
ncbi:hypothetical protein G9A89_009850 [Geosiphon pyriformis]|nr:hypothetical protein G9A89_009850 [Geosiphon pyriformis]